MKTFNEFKNGQEELSEGVFTKLASLFTKMGTLFANPAKLEKSVETTADQLGEAKTKKFIPKQGKPNESFIVQMGDPKKPETKYTMSLTKMADLPDGSGIFQISGSTSKEMLKVLTGGDKQEGLAKNNVMAILPANGLEKGKFATMRILKNVIPGDKDYVTKVPVISIVPGAQVEMNAAKDKTTK